MKAVEKRRKEKRIEKITYKKVDHVFCHLFLFFALVLLSNLATTLSASKLARERESDCWLAYNPWRLSWLLLVCQRFGNYLHFCVIIVDVVAQRARQKVKVSLVHQLFDTAAVPPPPFALRLLAVRHSTIDVRHTTSAVGVDVDACRPDCPCFPSCHIDFQICAQLQLDLVSKCHLTDGTRVCEIVACRLALFLYFISFLHFFYAESLVGSKVLTLSHGPSQSQSHLFCCFAYFNCISCTHNVNTCIRIFFYLIISCLLFFSISQKWKAIWYGEKKRELCEYTYKIVCEELHNL